jgi:ADP-ribose pyrophosphatase
MLQEVIEKSKCLFHGLRFEVRALEETIGGKAFKREFVAHPGSVTIIPLFANGDIALIKNRRFAVNEILWELPAGTLEPGEDPAEAAGRELLEETGYESSKVEFLFQFFTSPGISNEAMRVYLAQELVHKAQDLDESEEIEVVRVSSQEALKMIEENKIKDGKTIAALLFLFARS